MDIHYFETLPSTNTALLEMSKKGAKSWTAVWTKNQTRGRGYTGNRWETEKDKNIALSILITNDLNYQELIYFNQWVCNSICSFLSKQHKETYVKWPNDIIIKNKKVGGILIETHKFDNQLNIITGIGINVNQTEFPGLSKAGSLATANNQFYDIDEILSGILTKLEDSYFQIQNKEWNSILENYNSKLFLKDQPSLFKVENQFFQGTIQQVDEWGLLHVKVEDGIVKSFKNKEIQMIY